MDTNQEPPKTVKELGIHVFYQKEEQKKLYNLLNEVNQKLDRMTENFVTKQELLDAIQTRRIEQKSICENVQDIDSRLTNVENVINAIKNRIVLVAVSMLVMMILAQYGIQQFFKG